jgi:NitT/TauT family transport system substrate-binding protein
MRDWATAHPGEIKSLQGALADAEDFANREPEKTKADVAAHLKMPPELVQRLTLSHQEPTLTAQQLGWWVEVMKRNNLIAGTLDPAKMILAR